MSFEDAWSLAQRENLELAQQRNQREVSVQQLRLARSSFDPTLSASVSANQSKTPSNVATDVTGGDPTVITNGGTSYNASIRQNLPTGGSLGLRVSEFVSTTDSANALSDRFISTSAGVSLDQPLLSGLANTSITRLRDAQLDLRAQELRWQQQQEDLYLQLADAYWSLVSSREQMTLVESAMELAESQLDRTLERQTAGFAGSGDVLQVRVLVGQARGRRVDAKAQVGSDAARLARLLGLPLASGVDLELVDVPVVPDVLPSREDVQTSAKLNNAQYKLAEIDRERADRARRRARLQALPNVDLSAGAGWSAGGVAAGDVHRQLIERPAPSYNVGLSVGLPLVPRQMHADLSIARLRHEQAELAWKAVEQDLLLQIDDLVRDLKRGVSSLDLAQQTLDAARASLGAQRELLAEGRGSTRDVVDSLESLRSAEAGELRARISLQRRLLNTRRAAGTLLGAR